MVQTEWGFVDCIVDVYNDTARQKVIVLKTRYRRSWISIYFTFVMTTYHLTVHQVPVMIEMFEKGLLA